MSKPEENTSDDEFHDADVGSTKYHNDLFKKQLEDLESRESYLKTSDEESETEDQIYHETADDDDEPDNIDEVGMKEEEEFLTEEQKLKNKEEADKLKVEGNELFKNEKYKESCEAYTRALRLCPLIYKKDRAVYYANRAASKIQQDLKDEAIEDCDKAIKLNPDYIRALMRRAKLYEKTDKPSEALEDYKKIVQLDPSNRDANEACYRLPPIINERNEKLKAEMMGQLKNLGNMILKPFGLSTSNFQVNQDPSTGSYSINMTQ